MKGEDQLKVLSNEPALAEAVEEVKFSQSCWPLPSRSASQMGLLTAPTVSLHKPIPISKAQGLFPCWEEGSGIVCAYLFSTQSFKAMGRGQPNVPATDYISRATNTLIQCYPHFREIVTPGIVWRALPSLSNTLRPRASSRQTLPLPDSSHSPKEGQQTLFLLGKASAHLFLQGSRELVSTSTGACTSLHTPCPPCSSHR